MNEINEFPDEAVEECPLCHYEMEHVDCDHCSGDGGFHDCGEDTCCCADPDDDLNEQCEQCNGHGGYMQCPNAGRHDQLNPEPMEDRR